MKNPTTIHWLRVAYAVVAWLFVIALLMQVLLIGLSLFTPRPMWSVHGDAGHSIGGLVLILLILAYVARVPRPAKVRIWLLFGVYIFQAELFAVIRGSVPYYAALHPVLALVLFWLAVTIAQQAWAMAQTPAQVAGLPQSIVESAAD